MIYAIVKDGKRRWEVEASSADAPKDARCIHCDKPVVLGDHILRYDHVHIWDAVTCPSSPVTLIETVEEKPYTMVHARYEYNGVTYEARGWALWDGQGEWVELDGWRIALKRAKRKIARRLKWEAGLPGEVENLGYYLNETIGEERGLQEELRLLAVLHRDGGTVQL